MKYFFLILFMMPILIYANPITCKFEEVYPNGDLQQGSIYIQDNNIRYEYSNLDLYTLIYKKKKLYFIRNREPDKFEKITKNADLFLKILEINKEFPDIDLDQTYKEMSIKIELNENDRFIKRLAINSQDLKLSIYFIDCNDEFIDKEYFSHNPFKKTVTIDQNIF